jgi:hypothetical protein
VAGYVRTKCLIPGTCAGILEQSMRARNQVGKEFSLGPPGYIGWGNRFLEINCWTPLKFKNTASDGSHTSCLHTVSGGFI